MVAAIRTSIRLALPIVLLLTLLLTPSMRAQGTPAAPDTMAENAVVISDFGTVLYDKNAHRRTAMASTTKIMTSIVAVRYGNLDQIVLIDESDIVGEASAGLWAGQEISLHDLIFGLLLPSGNDAAHAISRAVGEQLTGKTGPEAVQAFVDMMNVTAREYGLRNTHFMNPHGLDQYGHYSTPFDLAIMLRAALNYPFIHEVMTTRVASAGGNVLYNGNRLLDMRDDVIGGKTGFTDDAIFCLAAAASRGDRFVIAVVTRDDGDNWTHDVSNLLEWGLIATNRMGVPPYADPALVGTQFNQSSSLSQGSP